MLTGAVRDGIRVGLWRAYASSSRGNRKTPRELRRDERPNQYGRRDCRRLSGLPDVIRPALFACGLIQVIPADRVYGCGAQPAVPTKADRARQLMESLGRTHAMLVDDDVRHCQVKPKFPAQVSRAQH